MAEGDITFYNNAKVFLQDGTIDLDTDTIKVALVTGYSQDIDAHDFWDDVSGSEISATNYSAGGATLANSDVTVDTGNDRAVWDADNVTWSSLGAPSGSISHAIGYKDTGTPSTSPLIFAMEIATDSNGGDYTIAWNGTGISTLT